MPGKHRQGRAIARWPMKSAAPTAKRRLTKRRKQKKKKQTHQFLLLLQLLQDGTELEIGASESCRQRSGLDCVPLCVGDQDDLTAAFAHWSPCHIPPNAAVWIVAFSRFRFNGTMRSRRTVEGPRKWAFCEIRAAQAPGTETVRFRDDQDDKKAKDDWCCGEGARAEQIEATVGAVGWHGFHSVVARGEGALTVLVHTPYRKRDAFMLTPASPDSMLLPLVAAETQCWA
ncbi:hypothetical protein J3F84DRAFT_324535 [Trichoderma pleuroticola]